MKKEIIILEEDTRVKLLLAMHIESEFNATLHYAENVKEAIQTIKDNRNISLVVANYMFKEQTTSSVYYYITQENLSISFILITPKFPVSDDFLKGFFVDQNKNKYLHYPVREHEFVEAVSTALNIGRPSASEKYRRVRGNNLNMFIKRDIQIYQYSDDNEYIKCASQDCSSDIEDFYFVEMDDYKVISAEMNKMIKKKLSSNKISVPKKIDLQLTSVQKIHSCLSDLGLSSEEIELGESVYESSKRIVATSKKASTLLSNLVRYQSYTHELSVMTNYLAIAMVTKSKWSSAHSIKKLSMSAIFQDLSLSNDKQAKIVRFPFDAHEELTENDKKIIIEHPAESVKLVNEVQNIGDISNNIQDIVLSHHERPYGKGFPKQLTAEHLSGLACVFIIAHEFSHRILEKTLTIETLEQLKADFEADYSTGRFRIPYEAFLAVFNAKRVNNLS
jgi:response regulator RpfG family c-di-GMP phosphodiesterase